MCNFAACNNVNIIRNMGIENGIFKRAELLLGEDVMGEIASKRVIVFGVGGVGSWCVECLVLLLFIV